MSSAGKYVVIIDAAEHEKWFDGDQLIYEKTKHDLQAWYLNNKYHRENGPAFIDGFGTKYYYVYGQLHREDGPAVEYFHGDKEWFLFGEPLSEEQYNNTIITPLFEDLEKCNEQGDAYQLSKAILEKVNQNNVNKFKLIKHIKDRKNKWLSILLKAMANTNFVLTNDLIKVIINYIDDENEELVQASALSLLYGGEESMEVLLNKLVPTDKYRKILNILFAANPGLEL